MKELRELRKQIDKLDTAIIKKIAQRMKIAKKIGHLKAKSNRAVLDKKRENYLEKMYKTLSKEHNLDEKLVKGIFKNIIIYSRGVQR